jgi:hypothetical protein
VNVCMGSQYLSVTYVYTDTQSHKCAQMVEFSGEYGNTWVFGSGNSVSFCRCPWILGFYRCLALPGTGGVRRSKGANLDLWIFGFSVPSEIRYPLVGALGSSDSIGAWRFRVPMESEDPGVPSVYWGFMRVVWFFRFSA